VFAYFDESGKFKDSQFVCIAGFVSDEAHWNAYAQAWGDLLQTHKIPTLHMRELMSFTGPFKGWDREHAKKALAEFIDVIRRNVLIGLGVGFDSKYLTSMRADTRKKIGDPQYFCFQRILRLLVNKLAEIGYKGQIPVTFDDTQEHGARCYRMWSRLREEHPELKRYIPAITFADADMFYPLQGADVLAHQTRDHQLRMTSGRATSQHFENLMFPISSDVGIHYDSEFWNKDMLDDLEAKFDRGEVKLLI
jgi:Protein of unknown function (DUF3800)